MQLVCQSKIIQNLKNTLEAHFAVQINTAIGRQIDDQGYRVIPSGVLRRDNDIRFTVAVVRSNSHQFLAGGAETLVLSLENRAKIFSPFAALRGYEDKIALEDWRKNRVSMPILSDGEKEVLSAKLSQLTKGQAVSLTYFIPDEIDAYDMPIGVIHTLAGTLEKIDLTFQNLRIGGRVIPFDLILDVADELPD